MTETEQRFAGMMWEAYSAAGKPYGDTQADAGRWSGETEEGRKAIGDAMDRSGLFYEMLSAALPTIIEVMRDKDVEATDGQS